MRYDIETINQVNNSINIVKYAKQYLNLTYKNGEWWTNCCFHANDFTPSLSFNEEKNVFKCLGCGLGGTPILFVQHYHKLSFPKAIEYLINYSGVEIQKREFSKILDFLHKTKLKNRELETINRNYLPDNYMKKFVKEPIKEWLNEGIRQEILDKYDVRYDKYSNNIVFPIRDINGKIITIKARTLYPNYEDLGLTKYIYYTKIITNNFLFGLYENYNYIKEKNEVIVFEGCKSVMKAEGYGYPNCVSMETDNINEYQIHLLSQLKVNIVFALDKGVKITTQKKNMKNSKYIYVNIGLLPKLTNVYVVEDKFNLLQPKDSPVDQGKEVWEKLYEARYKI